MSDPYSNRRDKLRHAVQAAGCDAMLVTHGTNVTYLTGFTGDSSYLLLRRDGECLLSDSRFTEQIAEECEGLAAEIRGPGVSLLDLIERVIRGAKVKKLAIEAEAVSIGFRDQLAARPLHAELVPTSNLVETLRMIKGRQEVAAIRSAIACAAKSFAILRATLHRDKSEIQIRDELEYHMRVCGASDRGFPSIIAVGPRAALPHAVPTDRRVGSDSILLVDWGAKANLYVSDLTRVLVTGKLSAKFERVYNVVLEAQRRAIETIRPGVTGEEVDRAARGVIEEAGFGKFFGHGLGHGIGLDVHESPRLAMRSETVLKPGMVVTVEPGIYLPGWGGVRIEDDVLVTRDGSEVLSQAVPRGLEEMMSDV